MFRRILVPVDGSRTALRGLAEAVQLAKDQRAKLRIVHVVDEHVALSGAELGVDIEAIMESLTRVGRKALERARSWAAKRGVEPEVSLQEAIAGSAAGVILRDARKWKADLIVMGTHGRRGLRRVVMGSDAEQVVREATVPVMLVRGR